MLRRAAGSGRRGRRRRFPRDDNPSPPAPPPCGSDASRWPCRKSLLNDILQGLASGSVPVRLAPEHRDAAVDGLGQFGVGLRAEDRAVAGVGVEEVEIVFVEERRIAVPSESLRNLNADVKRRLRPRRPADSRRRIVKQAELERDCRTAGKMNSSFSRSRTDRLDAPLDQDTKEVASLCRRWRSPRGA